MNKIGTVILALLMAICLLPAIATRSFAATKDRKRRVERGPTRAEAKEAERRLNEMGFWTGPVDGSIDGRTQTALVAFQKWEGLKVTGRLTRTDVEAIMNAAAPQPRDPGYKHVEIDIGRQVLVLTDESGAIAGILPVSTGSDKRYNEKGMRGLAYTPRGRFRIYGKASGWKKSPLGLLYYPSYFSDGLAIHGNPEVPHTPASHGCIRIPMFASVKVSKMLPVGTIVLLYDQDSFVSAKDWAEEDKQKQASANVP
jgi:peptidoglycan hydrolase-like protein with peptidoglycan-binding domain